MRMKKSGVALCLTGLLLLACESDREGSTGMPEQKTDREPSAAAFSLLPEKKELPLTAATYCEGIQNVLAQTRQPIAEQAALLCNSATPTALLNNLLAAPYQGVGPQVFTTIRNGETGSLGQVQLTVAFAMKINKKAVPLLLAEEPYIIASAYDQPDPHDGRFKMSYKFVTPPANANDCDTGFRVEQFSSRHGKKVSFDDTSLHDLKLYRMFPNNFDFLVAARTLVAPTEQFKKSVALRGVMTDPQDSDKAISVTVIDLLMNGRGRESELLEIVNGYVASDMRSVYSYHQK